RHPAVPECSGARIADYACPVLQSFRISVAHKFHERAVGIAEIDRCPWPLRAEALHRTTFHCNAVRFEVRNCSLYRPNPLKTQIAVARLDRQTCHFRWIYAGTMHIELLVPEPVGPTRRALHQLSTHHVAVELV